jgi:uncharacterized protein
MGASLLKITGHRLAIATLCVATAGCQGTQGKATMSPDDQRHAVAVLRSAYAAFNRDDIAAAVGSFDPGIEWTEPQEFPGGGTYHGTSEVAGYLAKSRAGWAEGASEPEEFILRGNRVVVFVHARIRLQGSQAWNDVKLADVYTFSKGRPVQMRAFADRQAALKWAGAES